MCGIIGYIGKREALPILLQGLRDLEYRGYDSAGIAVIKDGKIERIREVGKVDMLVKKIDRQKFPGNIGIAHTRWATHGGVTQQNAHPHLSGNGEIAVVHNGIIENYQALRDELKGKGHAFQSETDTEVIPHLIEEEMKSTSGDFAAAVRRACRKFKGRYAILALHKGSETLVAARTGSPLIVGVGGDG